MIFLDRLKTALNQRGLTIKQLSEQANISEQTIYSWKKSNPKADVVSKIATTINVSSDYLLGLTDDPSVAGQVDMTPGQREVAYFIDPRATEEDIEQIKKLVEIAKLSKRRL
jgi:transcriptional regulator with XRE-family HTH domain